MKLKIKTCDRFHDEGDVTMSTDAEPLPMTDQRRPSPPLPTPSSARPAPTEHTVHWFRKGLRLHDNPALKEGLLNAATFRCVFIIDPWFASSSNVGINKWRFLLQCLEDLDRSLRKLNSRLFVIRGQPADALPKLFREWGTTTLSFEEDPEPYGRVRDHNISTKCRECGISVITKVSHTLYKLDTIIERNGGKAPLTYHQFQALVASMPPPQAAESAITTQTLNGATTPLGDDHDDRFGVPSLEELGFDTDNVKPPVWIGGETEALARLERHLERKAWVASFGRPKMTPQSLLASKTGLSPYLRFGCLSTRLFYYQLTDLYKRVKGERPPLSLHGQILWREFFYCAATRNPNFDRMEGNPICVQIPWEKNTEALAKWANGTTGYPWIDAIMIQLREEGWVHHLARHAVACFLTRGDLWISWEEGMKVFDELLLDADWSVNAGMWMWLSCSSFFQQFFHCYCPVRFGRKTDPNGDFIRRYIPALASMPSAYIHEPWAAPEAVQRAARCAVGRDYPRPMVEHARASQLNIVRIKQVYAQLAKYKTTGANGGNGGNGGGGSLNPQTVQRPSVTQSSPSPTSIIASINQSNFLCSQAPDPQKNAHLIPYKLVSKVIQRTKHTHRTVAMSLPFKEIVIIQQPQNSNVSLGSSSESLQKQIFAAKNGGLEAYKLTRQTDSPVTPKQENYDFKNLAINNYSAYSIPRETSRTSETPNEMYEHVNRVTKFDSETTELSIALPPTDEQTPSPNLVTFNQELKTENTNEENQECLQPLTINTDESYTGQHDNTQSNE